MITFLHLFNFQTLQWKTYFNTLLSKTVFLLVNILNYFSSFPNLLTSTKKLLPLNNLIKAHHLRLFAKLILINLATNSVGIKIAINRLVINWKGTRLAINNIRYLHFNFQIPHIIMLTRKLSICVTLCQNIHSGTRY